MKISIPDLDTHDLAVHYIRLRDIIRTYKSVGRTPPTLIYSDIREVAKELFTRLDGTGSVNEHTSNEPVSRPLAARIRNP